MNVPLPFKMSHEQRMFLLLTVSFILWMVGHSNGSPVPLKYVDMTYTLDDTTQFWPNQQRFKMKMIIQGITEQGFWLQAEEYVSATHVGTHMDAPCHFAKDKWCIDQIPLERLSAPVAVVDITLRAEFDADATVEVDDLKKWERISGKNLNGTIVAMRTGWGRWWNDREAFIGTSEEDARKLHFPGMSADAAQWLVDNRDIYGVLSETLSLDSGQRQDYMAHRILLGANIYGLENVANVEKLPIVGATIQAMPIKIGDGSGAPTRIIATFPEETREEREEVCLT